MGLAPNNRMKASRLPVSVEVNLMVQSQTVISSLASTVAAR